MSTSITQLLIQTIFVLGERAHEVKTKGYRKVGGDSCWGVRQSGIDEVFSHHAAVIMVATSLQSSSFPVASQLFRLPDSGHSRYHRTMQSEWSMLRPNVQRYTEK